MVKRDDRGGSLRFDDETSRSDAARVPEPRDGATIIDEPLGQEVASQLRALRKQLVEKREQESTAGDVEKTAFVGAPTFDEEEEEFPRLGGEDDDHPTMWDADVDAPTAYDQPAYERPGYEEETLDEARLGSAIPQHTNEREHTERALIPIIEPPKPAKSVKPAKPPKPDPEASAEFTRKEPIPMELFFETAEPEAFPPSARPPQPSFARSKPAQKPALPVEEPSDPAEQTMLDLAAAVGIAPESVQRETDEDTFDEPRGEPSPRLPLPAAAGPELDLTPFVEEEQSKARKTPREGIASEDIRRYAQAAESTSKVIPIVLGIFAVIATLYAMVSLFHGTAQTREEHVELRFLATLSSKSTEVVTREGSKLARIHIETVPPALLVLHNREILGKTPLTVDLPIELGEQIGVELSGPYYQTWISQGARERENDEYRIRAELTKK